MATMHAYLNFNGNCEEAFTFYETVFNTKVLGWSRFGDMPANESTAMKEEDKNKILNTCLFINESTMILGSDVIEGFGHPFAKGNNTYIMLDASSADEAKQLFQALSNGAQVEMEIGETFFAELYGSLVDKFGIPWMVHFEGNKAQNPK